MAHAVLFNSPKPFTTWKWRETGQGRSQTLHQGTALLHLPWHVLREKVYEMNFPTEKLNPYQSLMLVISSSQNLQEKAISRAAPAASTQGKWWSCLEGALTASGGDAECGFSSSTKPGHFRPSSLQVSEHKTQLYSLEEHRLFLRS